MNRLPFALHTPSLTIELHDGHPGIARYLAVPGGTTLSGSPVERSLWVVLLDRSSGEYAEAERLTVLDSDGKGRYVLGVELGGSLAARVALRFGLEGNTLSICSEILDEVAPFEVASVFLRVFEVGVDEPGAALVLPTRSGRIVDIAAAKPETGVHKVDWFEPAPVAMAVTDQMLGVLTLDTVDSQFVHEIADEPRRGSIDVELLHRHRAEKPENSFLAQRAASCKVRLVAASPGEKLDWTRGAALVRDTIAPNLNDLYVGALVYKVMLQVAGSETAMTYADVLDLIRRVRRLTGGARQIVYLVGWQHGGHDTGYPDVYTANPRVGTFEEFRLLKEAAKAENALVSLHDNYHDAYMDSPLWDPAIVCIDRDGELRKGGIWGGGQAYEIGPTKYVDRAIPRAKWTVETLGLEQTTHLDVLSDKPDMVDYDPMRPANREQNAAAKHRIVDAFRSLGVDVTSEVLTSPFVSFMHHFWHVERRPAAGWGPHERIPLVPFIYHGKVTAGGDAATDEGKLDQIEYGWAFSIDWTSETTDLEICEMYYLVAVPWSLLATREITGFERDGDWEKVIYDGETYVRVNRASISYEVVVDGALVAKDFATFARVAADRWAVYSRNGGMIAIPSAPGEFEVTSLGSAQAPGVQHSSSESGLSFVAEAGVPYRVDAQA